MGVYIKELEKPNNCDDCPLCGYDERQSILFCRVDNEDIEQDMRDNCPLIEISTPHGRMIDADALFEAMGLDNVKEVMLRNWKFTTAWGVPIIETEE